MEAHLIMRQKEYQSPFRHKQQGVVLFIALIILLAMTMAGIAMVRSIDTGNLVAGNLAFKQSSLMAADRGIQAGFTWLNSNIASLSNTNTGRGYFSSITSVEPNWYADTAWTNAVTVGTTDAAGNTVQYVIHRLCTQPNTAYNGQNSGVDNQCATSQSNAPTSNASAGSSMQVGASVYQLNPMVYYRITARVIGPRNTVSVAQATVMIPV